MELSGVGSSETLVASGAVTNSQCLSDINRNIETEKLKSSLLDNSCRECNIKFDSSKSLEVHLQYHNKNLYTKWASEGVGSVESSVGAPPPPHTPTPAPAPLTTVTCVSAVESPASVAVASVVSSPAVGPGPAGSMQISMAQSMGIQQGAPPPHLSTHHTAHTSPIFNSQDAGQSTTSPATPSLPSINTDVSEFFSQLENNSEPSPHENLTLETFQPGPGQTNTNGAGADKNPRFHPYGARQPVQFASSTSQSSAMSQTSSPSVSVQSYQSAYNSPFHDSQVYSGGTGTTADYLNFSEAPGHSHDQSSEEIWDMDSHCTVRRYNPGPDPVSPGPIPTTPTMYGQQMQQQKSGWETPGGSSNTANLYSPYGAISRGQQAPPQSLSPGLGSQWMGGLGGMKAAGGAGQLQPSDSKRPKSYQCEACDKWFTSSGHLKRHFNTTLHKNAMKQKGDSGGYIDGLNGGSFSIPSVESRGAPSPCMSLGEESSQSSVCEDSTPGSGQNIVSLNQPAATSLPDNCSPSSNTSHTSPNVPTQSPMLSPGPDQDCSPLSGLSQLAGVPPGPPSTPGLLCSSSPTSNLNASPASHKNRFSPFRSGVGQPQPVNSSNPSYKVQNLDQRQAQSYQQQHHPSYTNTFQSPSSVVSSHNFNNGDIYLSQHQNLSSGYHRDQTGYPQTGGYTGQYHAHYQPIIYSSSYDMSANHNNYLSHNNFNDISSYTPMPQDGLNSIFPEHVNSIRTIKKERNSPEGSEGSDSLNNEIGEFRCNECNKVFQKICYLKQHNKSFHNGEKPFKCTQCGKRFPVELLYQVVRALVIFIILSQSCPTY